MDLTSQWYACQRIAVISISGELSMEQLSHIDCHVTELLTAVKHPIHLVFDCSNVGMVPTQFRQLRQRLSFLEHPHLGLVVIMSGSKLVNFLANVLTGFAKVQMLSVDSLEEAFEQIQRIDSDVSHQR